jgi:hypothetical protein
VALGGHVIRCEDCLHTQSAYSSCRNRHCPKCQGSQALAWMKERKSELLDVPYFHVVFPSRAGTRVQAWMRPPRFTTAAFDRSSSWQFEASSYKAALKDPPSSLVQHSAFLTQSPVNASRRPSRDAAHHSGSGRLA